MIQHRKDGATRRDARTPRRAASRKRACDQPRRRQCAHCGPKAITEAKLMQDIRCGTCSRKLGETEGVSRLAIKCPRCKTLNHFSIAGLEPQSSNAAERPAQGSAHANNPGD